MDVNILEAALLSSEQPPKCCSYCGEENYPVKVGEANEKTITRN